jgi:hypothetical protein
MSSSVLRRSGSSGRDRYPVVCDHREGKAGRAAYALLSELPGKGRATAVACPHFRYSRTVSAHRDLEPALLRRCCRPDGAVRSLPTITARRDIRHAAR